MTMSNKAIFLFIILLLGLILCSFLGRYYSEGFTSSSSTTATEPNIGVTASSGTSAANNVANSYDNYDHYSGSAHPTTFYGPNGGTAKLVNANGQYAITLTDSNGKTTTYMVQGADTGASASASASPTTNSIMANVSNKTFYGPNGGSASVYASTNGQYAIEITLPNGTSTIYTATNSYMYNDQSVASAAADSPAATTSGSATTTTPTTDYTNNYKKNYYNDPSLTANGGSSSSSSANEDGAYDSSMPQGISKSMIAPGQEDLYILKSEIVPPVCPACPQSGACPRKEKCPACKPCGRCPEPNYNCKLVPNYSATNQYLPTPILNSFSTFGM
uniref:Uncharacterized protein n=1 Tax=viral metagenome TaxID=1070528 RepID=A0A6C0ETY9_9ZZZZ